MVQDVSKGLLAFIFRDSLFLDFVDEFIRFSVTQLSVNLLSNVICSPPKILFHVVGTCRQPVPETVLMLMVCVCIQEGVRAVPYLRITLWKSRFNRRKILVGFVVDEVSLGHVFS